MRQLVSFVLLGSSLVACVKSTDSGSSTDTAESVIDNADSVSAEGNVMMAAMDGSDMTGLAPLTGDQVAARVAANAALRWQPSGCASVARTGSMIAITFNDCTGPRGLLHVTGELDLTVSVSGTGTITAHAASNNLEANGAALVISADASYAVSGTNHTLTVQSQGEGTGPRGNAIDHDGQYTLTWDTSSQCHTIDGHWATEITGANGSAQRSNDVNLRRCVGGCPTGTVTHHFLGGQSITITFDGSNVAQWQGSGGRSGTVNLMCQ